MTLRDRARVCSDATKSNVRRLGDRRCPAESHRRRVGSRVFHRRVGAYSSVGSFSRGRRQISPPKSSLDESSRGPGCHAGSHLRRHIHRADLVPVTTKSRVPSDVSNLRSTIAIKHERLSSFRGKKVISRVTIPPLLRRAK